MASTGPMRSQSAPLQPFRGADSLQKGSAPSKQQHQQEDGVASDNHQRGERTQLTSDFRGGRLGYAACSGRGTLSSMSSVSVPGLKIPGLKPAPKPVVCSLKDVGTLKTSARKTSARYSQVQARYMQPSARSVQCSTRLDQSARSGSVAANVGASRNKRIQRRYQPTVEEISRAIQDRPHLTLQIVAVRDDPTLDKAQRMMEIGKLMHECDAPVPVDELDRLQANYTPTRPQMNGRRKATTEQTLRVKEAEKHRISQPESMIWAEHGGEEVEAMLKYVDLIDARYLISLHEKGGTLPCWQALPPSAFINRANVWRLYGWEARGCLGVVVLSYPWLDYEHPDREGETLGRLVPVLQCMLPFCGGEHFTVGVLWDYGSLPQPIRSHAELARHKLGLRAMMMWLAHPYTPVLCMSGSLPTGAEYKNSRPHSQRGWCETERRVSELSKSAYCLWDIAGFKPEKLDEVTDERKRFDMMRAQLSAKRSTPLAPPQFAVMMQKRVSNGTLSFSTPADLKLVNELYRIGFVAIFENYRRCDPMGSFAAYAGQAWGEVEARQVAIALEYAAEKCKLQRSSGPLMLRLEGNCFGEAGERLIQRAVQFSKNFAGIQF